MNENDQNGERALLEIFSDPATLTMIEGGVLAAKEFFLARNYVTEAIASFQNDPADSDFQRGYLAALEVVGKEALGMDIDLEPEDPEIKIRKRRGAFRLVEKD